MSKVRSCAFVSFRLGLADGVSIVASRWAEAFDKLGYRVITVAGEGPVDHVIDGLAIGAASPPTQAELASALDGVDLVVVENLCTIPMNLPASRAVATYLAGRPTIMHHHDPPWQRERYGHINELPMSDPAWRHVTINMLTERQMRSRGFEAVTIYNPFKTDEDFGDRDGTRASLDVGADELLVVHPVRAIPRKNIPLALRLAEELEGIYWLLGEAEEGYGAHLEWLLSTSQVPVIQQPSMRIPDIYAASDVVVFPSLWEGFGNPPIEASIHLRPVIVGNYPVASELSELGFKWFRPDQVDEVRQLIANPDHELLARNRELAREKFSVQASMELIAEVIERAGWW